MKEIDNPIPADKRWEISAAQNNDVIFAYELAIRRAVPGKMKDLEDETRGFWKRIGKKRGLEAREMCSAPETAIGVAEAMNAYSNSIFGSRFGYEIRPGRGDSAFAVAVNCPLMKKSEKCLNESLTARNICMNYTLSAIEGINPDYAASYERQMCMGDDKCILKVEKRF